MTRLACRLLVPLAMLASLAVLRPVHVHAQNGPKGQQDIPVEVVDVAGGRAYVRPGESAGLRRGGVVVIRKRPYQVITATDGYAIIELREAPVRVGDDGRGSVTELSEAEGQRLPAPSALDVFAGKWPDARRPADDQRPQPVPLGPMQADGRTTLALSLIGGANVPLSSSGTASERAELRARLRTEPWRELPLRLDTDVATQLWLASDLDERRGDGSRPIVRVRQFEAAYGDARATFAALGRLRYASRALGVLDGAHLQAETARGLTLGAFGGFVPDPLDGSPMTDASRFGAEVGYEDTRAELRPQLSLTAQGSRFEGALDERKLTLLADVYPEASHFGAYGELSLYDSDNPWGARTEELSAAGADASVRFGVVELGGRVDLQRPERSRWLASFLPPGYLCTASTPVDDVPCFGDEARYLGSVDVGVRLERASFGATGSASTSQLSDDRQLTAALYASALDVIGPLRLDAGLRGSEGSFVHTLGASLGLGALLASGLLDVSVHYRPAVSRYEADTANYLEHTLGARVWLTPEPELELSLDADAISGRDVKVLLVQGVMTVRPAL